MTRQRRRQAVILTGGVLALAVCYFTYAWVYADPRDVLLKALTDDLDAVARYESALKQESAVDKGLKALGTRTLGGAPAEADANLRDTLFAVADQCRLSGIEVTTTTPNPVRNPVGESKLSTPLGRDLARQVDFHVFSGTLTGRGSLDAVMRAAATLDAQPWAHRVTTFNLKPVNKERTQFEVVLTVEAILTPDLATGVGPTEVTLLGDSAGQVWADMVRKNVFREPPPPVREAARQEPRAPTPQSPYAGWRVTGVVESRLGTEVWLVNDKSNERVALPVGGVLADAKLVSGSGELAVFEIAGKRYEVVSGQTLDQRRPLN